jgi:uncharacterized FlaG/YvyC family protein
MNAISSVSPIGFQNTGHEISEISNSQDRKVSSQKNNERLGQMNVSISKIIQQFQESIDVRLDFEIDVKKKCVSVKVINKASGQVIREIPVKPDLEMDSNKGVICETIA